MLDILQHIHSKKTKTPGGWVRFNAICCEARGLTKRKAGRGAVMQSPNGSWTYNCLNCGYKATYTPGRTFGHRLKTLLEYAGLSQEDINRANLESLALRDVYDIYAEAKPQRKIEFEEMDLPAAAVRIDLGQELHWPYVQYARLRGVDPEQLFITPDAEGREAYRVIIPFYYKHKLIGYTSRFFDERAPKYIMHSQPGYVFNTDQVKRQHEFVIVCEGVFDALALDGVALLHNDINTEQIAILKSLDKEIIIVPDQDLPGLKLAERAAEQGFSVSLPEWDAGVKDINDAVNAYGKLNTLVSIIRARERSRVKIELRRKQVEKRITISSN